MAKPSPNRNWLTYEESSTVIREARNRERHGAFSIETPHLGN
jgi:hypothetical protein